MKGCKGVFDCGSITSTNLSRYLKYIKTIWKMHSKNVYDYKTSTMNQNFATNFGSYYFITTNGLITK